MFTRSLLLLSSVALLASLPAIAGSKVPFPDPAVDNASGDAFKGPQTAVLAGGCFWGVQGVFERVKGVKDAVSGFAGGDKSTADYETVSTGRTGHAESVKITYN